MIVRRLAWAAALLLACARPYPPPGGEPDEAPPQIVDTRPAPLAVVPGYDEPVRFEFDERLSERGITQSSALVSPLTGEVEVSRGRRSVDVRMVGGWRPNTVYRVVLLPGVRDLFGNERREPAELVFSTGAELTDAALAGLVTERITGQSARNVVVEAIQRPDTTRYVTVADSAGFFALTHLPLGSYDIRAYIDANGNRRLDPSESLGAGTVITLNTARDTVPIEIAVIPQDTTPARLVSATASDSVTVLLEFDDYIDPGISLAAVQTSLLELPDSAAVPGTPTLVHPAIFEARKRAAPDTAAADSAAARPLPTPAVAAAVVDTVAPLPVRSIVLVPAQPLKPDTRYQVTIGPLLNVSQRYGGGGTAEFQTPPAAPAPAARDTGNAWPTRDARSRR